MNRNEKLIRKIYNGYFDRLKRMADILSKMQRTISTVEDPNLREIMRLHTVIIEEKIKSLAPQTCSSGIEIIRTMQYDS